MPSYQTIANICMAIALLIFVLPLQKFLWDYSHQKQNHNGWETLCLSLLVPLWLLLAGAIACVTASGGFDWLRLGRPAQYAFSIAATLALGALCFVFIVSYIRPGFMPRALFRPPIYLLPFGTMLLVILSFKPRFSSGLPIQLLRWPWAIVAALSLLACVGFGGYFLSRWSANTLGRVVNRWRNPGLSTQEALAQISTLDPQRDFDKLLGLAIRYQKPEVREAATARLRSNPEFLTTLSAELERGFVEPAIEFIYCATLTPAEQMRLAGPTRAAMDHWVNRIPAPNYTTKKHLRALRRWGEEMLRVLPKKFESAKVDFGPTIADLKEKVEAQ